MMLRAKIPLAVLCLLLALPSAQAAKLTKTCVLNADGLKVEVFKDRPVSDTAIVLTRTNNGAITPVFAGDDDEARGSAIKVNCAGTTKARALILSGEFFGSAYPKGFVIAWNPFLSQVQRLDFAERSRPTAVYMNQSQLITVLPNRGGESDSKYVIYVLDAETNKTDVSYANVVHVERTWVAIKLK